jgi:hypothetical protein
MTGQTASTGAIDHPIAISVVIDPTDSSVPTGRRLIATSARASHGAPRPVADPRRPRAACRIGSRTPACRSGSTRDGSVR